MVGPRSGDLPLHVLRLPIHRRLPTHRSERGEPHWRWDGERFHHVQPHVRAFQWGCPRWGVLQSVVPCRCPRWFGCFRDVLGLLDLFLSHTYIMDFWTIYLTLVFRFPSRCIAYEDVLPRHLGLIFL